jgi:salicylate hydroxylase
VLVNSDTLEVIIIGAGTGGLCLAQGLHQAGLKVRVFERDPSPTARLFGYRLNLNATGNRALETCLSAENYRRLVAACGKSNSAVSFMDQKLHRLLRIEHPAVDRTSPQSERPIGRLALRRILLHGLDDLVHFGNTFAGYTETDDGRVTVRFEDGSTAIGDVLVGADGASSRVCRQLLPHSTRTDTGLVAVSGKFPLDQAARTETPESAFRGPTLIMGSRGCFMFLSAVERATDAGDQEDAEEYVMWGFSARRETLGGEIDDSMDSASVKQAVLQQVYDWHPALRTVVERADPETLSTFAVKSAAPVPPWPTRRITLLGDALHNMTPFRGIGANTALRDAQALTHSLIAVARGRTELIPALSNYEKEMIRHGFAAVAASLGEMHRLHSTSPLQRAVRNSVFRVLDALPALQPILRPRDVA